MVGELNPGVPRLSVELRRFLRHGSDARPEKVEVVSSIEAWE